MKFLKAIRKPRTECPKCHRLFSARAILRHAPKCGRPNKYGAKKTLVGGEEFPSQLEAAVWQCLLLDLESGRLDHIQRYSSVELIPGIKWKVDFRIRRKGETDYEWVEAKGIETERYRILKKLWGFLGPGKLTVYKAGRRGPVESEVVIPAGIAGIGVKGGKG